MYFQDQVRSIHLNLGICEVCTCRESADIAYHLSLTCTRKQRKKCVLYMPAANEGFGPHMPLSYP